MSDRPDFMTVAQLSAVSGLDASTLADLAGQGYFPAATEDGYPASKSVLGVLRYYREWKERVEADPLKLRMTELRERLLAEESGRKRALTA